MSDLQQLLATIPFLRKVCVEIEEVRPDRVQLRLPYDSSNDNYIGTTHAGALFTFGETCAGVAAGAALDLSRFRMVARCARIEYFRPVRHDLRATAELDPACVTQVVGAVEREGRARLPVTVRILDADGRLAAEMTVEYDFRRVE